MNKVLLFVILSLSAILFFTHKTLQENSRAAQVFKAERDSLLVANKCPQLLRVQIHAGVCLNKAERHDRDLYISNFKTAAGDTVAFSPLCQSCFEKLSNDERWPFYERLIGLYEQQNRRDIQAQVKAGF